MLQTSYRLTSHDCFNDLSTIKVIIELPLGSKESSLHKLVFFVPTEHKEAVKQAVFDAGAGRYENYDCCAWETEGIGQFRSLAGSDPFIGKLNSIERVAETRVEIICDDAFVSTILRALIDAHPYETPAYEVWPILTIDNFT